MAITVSISKDKLSASVCLAEGDQPTALDIRKALQGRGVTFGYLEDVIEQLASSPQPWEVEVARGVAPVQGQDASVEYFFRTGAPDLAPQIREDGRADYFNLGVVQSVQAGDLLARKTPTVPGIPGRSVLGDDIPARPVKDFLFRLGKGVEPASGGLEVQATETGLPQLAKGLLFVSTTFILPGDVDFSVGNINFEGNVEVQGSVGTHFHVRAKGNITVQGTVEGGILEATGFIMVIGGVRQRAVLRADGDIQVRFMENSAARTNGNLFVKDDLLASEVDVGGTVEVEGTIVGGRCKAEVLVKAASIGGKKGTPTEVELMPLEKWREVLQGFERRQTEVKTNIERLDDGLRTLDSLRERFHGLHPDKEALYERMNQALSGMHQETVELAGKILQAKAKIESLPNPKVLVRDKIYPGVRIHLNSAHLNNEAELLVHEVRESEGQVKMN